MLFYDSILYYLFYASYLYNIAIGTTTTAVGTQLDKRYTVVMTILLTNNVTN